MSLDQRIVAVDLGKTRCRLVVAEQSGREHADGAGSPGLAAAGGVDAAVEAILPLLERTAPSPIGIDAIAVGAAGAWAAPAAAAALAERLASRLNVAAVVASDVVTAHAGALEGGSGALLIAGTGAAALGVDDAGVRLVDGWGPELGDLGGGSWLGRHGLRAVLRARDGLGGETALTAAAAEIIAPEPDVHAWLAGAMPVARRLASFAPSVLDAAASGDPVARDIAEEAIRLLAASAVAASPIDPLVAVHGGLTDHPWFRAGLENALVAAGRRIAPARGDAIAGALLLATRTDLPHERFLHRA